MILDYTWNMLENWFMNGTIEARIISLIVAIVITILAVWLTVEILKLTFLLVIEILKATFMSISIMFYTLLVVFLTAPIGLILKEDNLSSIINNYFMNVKSIVNVFYPKLFKEDKNKQILQYPVRQQRIIVKKPTVRRVMNAQQVENRSRADELNSKTVIISHPKKKSDEGKFFCTDCGSEFTPKMKQMLKENSYAFCEHCGKKFHIVNNLPMSA